MLTTAPLPRMPTPEADDIDYFGSTASIAKARSDNDALKLAWWLRQRDTRAALRHAAEAAAAAPHRHVLARLALVRGEAALLFDRLGDVEIELATARDGFVDHPLGLGDAALLQASLLDQQGHDRMQPLRQALTHYQAAGHAPRQWLASTWLACLEAMQDPDHAQARWGQALDDAAVTGDPGLLTFVEGARGSMAWRHGDPAAAIACYQRGFDAARACGQLQSAVTLALNIGIAFSTLNDHEGALDWAARARAIVEPTGWPYLTGWSLMQTGSMLLALGRAQAAFDLLQAQMTLFDTAQGSRNHVLACQVLGESCLELQRPDDGLRWLRRSLRGARAAPYPDLEVGSLRFAALAESRLGRVDAAVAHAGQALALAEAQDDWARQATIHHVLAEIARDHKLPLPDGSDACNATIHHLQAALDRGARMPGFSAPPDWLQALSMAQQAVGDLVGALASERRASRARQQQQALRSDELATAMLVRHRTAQAEAEAERQRVLAEASELRAELITSQGALEQERLQRMLLHTAKLAALGRLAAGVVHEMSHPVGTVALLAETLQAQLAAHDGAPSAIDDAATTLVGESRRLLHFVTRLRDFARAEPVQVARHDLRTVLADARQLFEPRLVVERIALEVELPSVTVAVDPQRLALAVANLVFNAADALAGRAEPRIWLHARVGACAVVLQVDDNGPGLSADVQAHLFEPFFTTRPQGLGLGLILSSESLSAMDGRLTAGQRPGGGARFTIELPLPGQPLPPTAAGPVHAA